MRFVSLVALGLCLSPAVMADEPQQASDAAVVEVAAAQPAPAIEPAADATQVADPDEKICKVRHKTGSRVRQVRTCMTRAEWQELRQHNSRMVLEDAGYTRQPEQ